MGFAHTKLSSQYLLVFESELSCDPQDFAAEAWVLVHG